MAHKQLRFRAAAREKILRGASNWPMRFALRLAQNQNVC